MEQRCRNAALPAKWLLKFSDWYVMGGAYSMTICPASLTCLTLWSDTMTSGHNTRDEMVLVSLEGSLYHLLDDTQVALIDNLFSSWQRMTQLLPNIHYPVHSLLVWYQLLLSLHNICRTLLPVAMEGKGREISEDIMVCFVTLSFPTCLAHSVRAYAKQTKVPSFYVAMKDCT